MSFMSHLKRFVFALILLVFCSDFSYAGRVSGYFRKNGTYVQSYYRSDSNGTVRDNYAYKGNLNPYTGKEGTNRYKDNPTSEYYSGSGGYNSNHLGVQISSKELKEPIKTVNEKGLPESIPILFGKQNEVSRERKFETYESYFK